MFSSSLNEELCSKEENNKEVCTSTFRGQCFCVSKMTKCEDFEIRFLFRGNLREILVQLISFFFQVCIKLIWAVLLKIFSEIFQIYLKRKTQMQSQWIFCSACM